MTAERGFPVLTRVRDWYDHLSIIWKVVLVYQLIVVIPSAGFMIAFSSNVRRDILEQQRAAATRTLSGLASVVAEQARVAEHIAESIAFDSDIISMMGRSLELAQTVEFRETVIDTVRKTLSYSTDGVSSLTVFSRNETLPEVWPFVLHYSRLEAGPRYPLVADQPRRGRWLSGRLTELSRVGFQDDRPMFMYMRPILSPSGESLGLVVAAVPVDGVWRRIGQLIGAATEVELLMSGFGVESQTFGEPAVGRPVVVSQRVEPLDAEIRVKLAAGDIDRATRGRTAGLLLILVTSMVAFLFLSMHFGRRLFGQLGVIVDVMDRVLSGHWHLRIPSSFHDEIGRITDDFNALIDRTNELFTQVVRKERMQKDVRLAALQYRLNPHMIYNMLGLFSMRLELHGDPVGSDAISDFGKMLRYTMDARYHSATIGEEIDHVRRFVKIENIRTSGSIELVTDIPDNLCDLLVPKFLLQPIAENSIAHGSGADRPLCIRVAARSEAGTLTLSVEDNGCGIDPTRLQTIMTQLNANDPVPVSAVDGVGLSSIAERLRLACSGRHGVQIESDGASFTRVTLQLPLAWHAFTGEGAG